MPLIAVVQRTDSFERIWPELVAGSGAELRAGATLAAVAPIPEACAVLLALTGAEEEAAALVREARAAGARAVAVIGEADHRVAVSVVRAGGESYFALPADQEALRGWLAERVEAENAAARAAAIAGEERRRYDFSRIIGRSPGLLAALERAARVIPRAPATVLITGETGTGKELLAHAIHHNGPRAGSPFLEINCTALPATLLEGELFGYERGAFTDARASKPGLFEVANGGTLFLDEIGDLTLEVQAKLLKVIEDREVRRLGSVRSMHVDVRLVAATHVDLAAAVAEGRFRSDLFYRLNVIPIHLPPLRERGDDVVLLAEYLLDQLGRDYGVDAPALTPELRSRLLAWPWPGNIRELKNTMERLVLLGDIPPATEAPPVPVGSAAIPFPARMDDIESAAARAMVRRFEGNKTAAADALGISRSRLYRLIGEDEGV